MTNALENTPAYCRCNSAAGSTPCLTRSRVHELPSKNSSRLLTSAILFTECCTRTAISVLFFSFFSLFNSGMSVIFNKDYYYRSISAVKWGGAHFYVPPCSNFVPKLQRISFDAGSCDNALFNLRRAHICKNSPAT